jgi:predicted alpha/beta hydrolase family esterase
MAGASRGGPKSGTDRTSGGPQRQREEAKVRMIMLKNETGRAMPVPEGADVLILPGLDNSGPGHWQTYWEALDRCQRVDFGEWVRPRLHEWVPALDRAIRASARPVVVAAHSLGCVALAWWAMLRWSAAVHHRVKGALLVAPPDVDAFDASPRLRDFRPLPRLGLPFPSVVVASQDDPYARFPWSRDIAAAWGSDFVDAGAAGHLNAESAIHEWPAGLRLLAGLAGRNPNLLVAELGLRRALA